MPVWDIDIYRSLSLSRTKTLCLRQRHILSPTKTISYLPQRQFLSPTGTVPVSDIDTRSLARGLEPIYSSGAWDFQVQTFPKKTNSPAIIPTRHQFKFFLLPELTLKSTARHNTTHPRHSQDTTKYSTVQYSHRADAKHCVGM